jgi:PIN domain nuclease of toxin-antitoxin system
MRLLLDTHIWLWSQLSPEKLSRQVARGLESSHNERWLSPVSLWELVILSEKGRVNLDAEVEAWVSRARKAAPVVEAPLTYEVALETLQIKLPHRDPADRLLVATARVFGLTLVTADERLIGVAGIPTLANR